MERTKEKMENLNQVGEEQTTYAGFMQKSEDEKLREDVLRPPLENFIYLHKCFVGKQF